MKAGLGLWMILLVISSREYRLREVGMAKNATLLDSRGFGRMGGGDLATGWEEGDWDGD
jgi:hypothetical protein